MAVRARSTPEPRERVCPICAMSVAPRPANTSFPFCRPACKLVDLGRWFSGAYRIPEASDSDREDTDLEQSLAIDADVDDSEVDS
jgi:uncharacterized protein